MQAMISHDEIQTNNFFEKEPVLVHLITGPFEDTRSHVKEYFMQLFCKKNSCSVCATCHAIKDEQYHATTWINPKDTYTLDDLDPIFSTISFALEHEQHHFFILCKADFLTPQCSNRLLKVLEEPPKNYHFILLAQRSMSILPTIRSRCIKKSSMSGTSSISHPTLSEFFTRSTSINPLLFYKELEQAKINDQETVELLDHLLNHFVEQTHKAADTTNKQEYIYAQQMIQIISQGLTQSPMPGSSALFWKNFMLEVQQLRKRS